MTARKMFHQLMAERRRWPMHSADWEYRTRAAKQLAWLIRGRPTKEWTQ